MEVILILILGIVASSILYVIISSLGRRTTEAIAKAATGRGTFIENMGLAFKGMGPLEARIVDTTLGDYVRAPVKAIEVKGLFPINTIRQVAFVTSVFDESRGELAPVLSAIDMYQEPDNTVYQHSIKVGQEVSPGQGFGHWTQAGRVIPNILQPPVGGARRLFAILRLVDADNMSVIRRGSHDPDDTGILWQTVLKFALTFVEKGYEEAAEHRDRARELSVRIGMAVAMADGTLDNSEGETLEKWILKSISPYADGKRDNLKALYNGAMKDAHSLAKNGKLDLGELTRELNEIAEQATKYETVELCFKVLAADGVVHPEELKVINKVADALDLDFGQIEKMREQAIISLGADIDSQASI
jgi:tellurite resistance protein